MSRKRSLNRVRRWLSPEEAARRRAEERPAFELGEPVRPQGLSRSIRRHWTAAAQELLHRCLLSRTDGAELLALAEARVSRDPAAIEQALRPWIARVPFPATEPPAPAPAAIPIAEVPTVPVPPVLDALAVAKEYAEAVIAGSIVAGKHVRSACQRFIDDLEHGADRGLTFDGNAAQRFVDYAGRLGLRLLPWQCFVVANLFGWLRTDGLRRFRIAHIEVSKKSGKSLLLSAIALYMTDPEGDGEPEAEVACAATCKRQAEAAVFRAAKKLLSTAPPDLLERAKQYRNAVEFGMSIFEPLASNSERLNGRNMHCGILDELAEHPDSKLFTVFETSMIARRQPLLISITTAGQCALSENVAWTQREHAVRVVEGVLQDDNFFGFIACLDPQDDWQDENNWQKSNPGLARGIPPLDNLRLAVRRAQSIPSTKAGFLRFHMNVWPEETSASAWVSTALLRSEGNGFLPGEGELCAADRVKRAEERLKGRACVAGLDVGLVSDFSSIALLFPPLEEKGIFEVPYRSWTPEDGLVKRSDEMRVDFLRWRDEGWLTPTPGAVTQFDTIRRDILALKERFRITELGIDRWHCQDLAEDLRREGMLIVDIKQGFWLDSAIQRTEHLLIERKLCTHSNPLAVWHFTNTCLDRNAQGRVRLDRERYRNKIDLAVATCIAMAVFLAQPPRSFDPNRYTVGWLSPTGEGTPPGAFIGRRP